MLADDTRDIIQRGYRRFLKARELNPRMGQKQMIAAVANALSHADQGRRISAVEAATGTGKTVAYLIAALPVARAAKKTVVVATGTVALQEQLINKDLPELIAACDWDYSCALVKGRGRYACNLRVQQHIDALTSSDAGIALFEDEQPLTTNKYTQKLYRELSAGLDDGSWDGDRDTWTTRIDDDEWRPLTVDRRQCSGGRCRYINQCAFFKARSDLEDSDCIVANHDIVMADLALGGGVILPPLEDSIYIFDEAHRLADTAVRHFGAECRINASLNWLEKLPRQCKGQAPIFADDSSLVEQLPRIQAGAEALTELFTTLYPLCKTYLDGSESGEDGYRFAHGDVGDAIRAIAVQIADQLSTWLGRLEILGDSLNEALSNRQYPVATTDLELFYQQVGSWQARAEKLLSLWQRLRSEFVPEKMPLACWLRLDELSAGGSDLSINASPIKAAELLAERLWGQTYGLILTSATLRSLGNFDSLRRDTGMPDEASCIAVDGAFDYARAALLKVPSDAVEGNQVVAHSRYLIDKLPAMFANHEGTLVLFSSRRQMQEVQGELPVKLRGEILMQGQFSNREMLRLHRERIDSGDRSVLFGLASFAEGVDLPGNYCRHVVIVKLPFAVPNDPLQEALSEWVENRGGNAFFDIALPTASLRLTQACGRLLRTETDTGSVTILDRRIVSKRYGMQLLNALPPFARDLNAS